jgi:8-oxo-dGTP diphosphatase
LREVREETAIEAELHSLIDIHEVILSDGQGLSAHYLIVVFAGRWLEGDPASGDDVSAARFVPYDALDSYSLTPGGRALIERGRGLIIPE